MPNLSKQKESSLFNCQVHQYLFHPCSSTFVYFKETFTTSEHNLKLCTGRSPKAYKMKYSQHIFTHTCTVCHPL